MTTVRQMPMVCPGHKRGIVELEYSLPTEEGLFLISGCLDPLHFPLTDIVAIDLFRNSLDLTKDGKPMLRDGVTGDWIGTFEGHSGAVWSACISEDTYLAATGSADQSASVWDARSGDQLESFPQKHVCKSAALSRDATQLLTGGLFKTVNLYDISAPGQTVLELPEGPVKFARFFKDDNNVIITGTSDGRLARWDRRSGSKIQEVSCGAEIRSGELRRSTNILSVVAADNSVQFWDSASLTLIKKYMAPDGTESCSLQPAEDKYVVCGRDLTVRTFSYDQGKELECLRGHHGPVMVVRFAPDGETYATGADDGTIRIWQTNPKPNVPLNSE